MAYCTIQQVRDATGMQNTTKIPDSYLTLKIAYADGIIISKIGERYVLPLSDTPDLIAFLSLEITIAILFIDQYGENSEDTDKGWERRLKFLMGQLEDLRTGKLKLINPTTGQEYPRTSLGQPSFYPNAESSDPDATDSTAPKVSMNQVW